VPKEVVLEVVKDASEAKQHQVKIAERVETTLETSCEIFYTTFAKREAELEPAMMYEQIVEEEKSS